MENLKNLTLDEIIENIILGKYPYYSDEYGQAVNRVYCLNNLTNPIETAQKNVAKSDDYLAYLDLIQADNYLVQFQAVSGLHNWCDDNWQKLALYSDLDFASIYRLPENIQAEWFEKITKNQPFVYSLIVLTAIYRQYHDKDWIISLCDTKNPYLFDFLNIYLFQAA